MISVILVAIPVVSAKGETPFVDCEEIFIDCSQALSGGGHWDDASADFRVFTFYNDSDSVHWCRETGTGFGSDDWDGIAQGTLQQGIKAVKFANNIYSFRIPANNLSHLRIVRAGYENGVYKKWNISPFMWNNVRETYTAGGKKIFQEKRDQDQRLEQLR